ncbi:response regulator transcription factor [Vibrio mimicus]
MDLETLLLIEDDLFTSRLVKHYFEEQGVVIKQSFDIGSAIHRLSSSYFSAIILDINLPSGSSLEQVNLLRSVIAQDTPIIFYTSNKQDTVELKGLEVGCADFVTKDRGVAVLYQRVMRLLADKNIKITDKNANDEITLGGSIRLKIDQNELTDGESVSILSSTECAILKILALSYPEAVTKDAVSFAYNGNAYDYTSRGLDIALSRIRRKIKPFKELKIKTIRNKGYKLEIES